MKLDPKCVRDVLKTSEKLLLLSPELTFREVFLNDYCSEMPFYSKENIAYTLILLCEAGYICCDTLEADDRIIDICVTRLTYSGHEFLDTIKSDNAWKHILSVIDKVGTVSLPIIHTLGSQYLTNLLFSQ